jgi:superfamily II DNA or RNA helicase
MEGRSMREHSLLRPYQTDLLDGLRCAVIGGSKRVVAYLPTGGGKTELAIEIIRRHLAKGGRVMFVVHLLELVEQTSKRFTSLGIGHGIVQGVHEKTDRTKDVQVCSIQTLNRRDFPPTVTMMIIDEAHHATSKTYRKFIAEHRHLHIIGLTATPFSNGMGAEDPAIGGALWQEMVLGPTISELTDAGWLVPADIYAPSSPDLTGVRTTAGDYNEADLAERSNQVKLVGDIVDHWVRLAKGMQTVCFAVDIAHSKHITQRFVDRGIAAEHIDAYSKPEERSAILGRLRSGATKVVSNCAVLAEGFDMPSMGCMILARPTKSMTRYLQMIGRALRPAEGKDRALILDHSGTVQRLGFPDHDLDLELDAGKPDKAGKAKKKEKLPEPCGNCSYVKPLGVHKCPECGFEPERANSVETEAGELVKISRKNVKRDDKQRVYSELLTIAEQRGYKSGWVANKYKAYFGVWPKGMLEMYAPASEEIKNWVLSEQIRFAKSKVKASITCPKCGGSSVTRRPGAGPHAAGAKCGTCGAVWWLSKALVEAGYDARQSA